MQILMFGWEFPPAISGGLGTACFGMTRALAARGHQITFVVPSLPGDGRSSHVELLAALDLSAGQETTRQAGIVVGPVESPLEPYMAAEQYRDLLEGSLLASPGHYGPDLFDEVRRYGEAAGAIARRARLRCHSCPRMALRPRSPSRPAGKRPPLHIPHSRAGV